MSKSDEPKPIRFKDLVQNYESLDPMDVDITYIEYISDLIPSDGYVDINNSEELATLFLKGANHCADLLSKISCYRGYCEAEKRAAKGAAIQALLSRNQSGTVAKEMYGNNEDFIKASNNLVMAESLYDFVENKRNSMIKAHHWFKDLNRSHKPQEGAANWESSSNFGKDFQDQPEVSFESKVTKKRRVGKKEEFKQEITWDEIDNKKK